MHKIAIIGCGQLGSRHLQGLLKIDFPISIDVVDLSDESLNLAKSRAKEIQTKVNPENIRYLTLIDQMHDNIDLCIIATSANIRFKVIKELLKLKKVKNLVLEKVLFQTIDEYLEAFKLFKKNKISCWVNCPRPMFEIYKDIKSKIRRNDIVTYIVTGGEWGLACNAIHFIDNMAYLTQQSNFNYDHSGISKIIEGKRNGFIEFVGTFIARQNNGSELILHSRLDSSAPLKSQIFTENYSWSIDEISGVIIESSKEKKWQEHSRKIQIPFQSDLTNHLASQILLDKKCDLTSYDISMKLHKNMIISFLEFYNSSINHISKVCPIT